jgi:hypothetical protein
VDARSAEFILPYRRLESAGVRQIPRIENFERARRINSAIQLIKICATLLVLACGFLELGCTSITHPQTLDFEAGEPSETEPVTAAMRVDHQTVCEGETFRLLVKVRIAGGHYIYGTNAVQGPFTPLKMKLFLSGTLEPAGDWVVPEPTVTRTGERVYISQVLLWQPLRVRLNTPTQTLSIKGELLCQACSEELCWPATEIALATSVEVVSKTK